MNNQTKTWTIPLEIPTISVEYIEIFYYKLNFLKIYCYELMKNRSIGKSDLI